MKGGAPKGPSQLRGAAVCTQTGTSLNTKGNAQLKATQVGSRELSLEPEPTGRLLSLFYHAPSHILAQKASKAQGFSGTHSSPRVQGFTLPNGQPAALEKGAALICSAHRDYPEPLLKISSSLPSQTTGSPQGHGFPLPMSALTCLPLGRGCKANDSLLAAGQDMAPSSELETGLLGCRRKLLLS